LIVLTERFSGFNSRHNAEINKKYQQKFYDKIHEAFDLFEGDHSKELFENLWPATDDLEY